MANKQTADEWTPKNGERVWIKVFSNWSLGTYVGFDTIENKHIVREDADGGGHLMASSQVLPEDENPNVPKQPTAVEWLVEQMRLRRDEGLSLSFYDLEMFAKKAKQMEKGQMCECYNEGLYQDIHSDTLLPFEQYYNKTYKNADK